MIRVGSGHDSHRLVAGRPLILGGVRIEHWRGLAGHSDADLVLHAVTDALLSAASLGDIGDHFPDNDPANKDADSTRFLQHAAQLLTDRGWRIGNVALTIFAEEPKLGPTKAAIRTNLARMLGIVEDAVNVQAKTGEGVGPIGRGEAMSCSAVVLIEKWLVRIAMPLRVYNTLTRQKEPFQKSPPADVNMYVCGPTVYKPSHIGHMVGPVIFDTVKRYLTHLGFRVKWVINITDVDDKLIVRAKELGTTVKDLAEQMTTDYFACLKKLNVSNVDLFPRATDHIPGMIAMMEGLISKGHAYAAGGDVYFDINSDSDYGKLCNRDPEQLEAGARIEVSDKKRNPGDFALWKAAKPGEPAWDSPWGPGRPGWHIECSVMSMNLLGETIDIHGGGLDLQFPHHENELAQSESFTGKPFARVWMHNNLLKMGMAKMAGSVGNVVNIADLLERHHPETVRFLLLSTHYRTPIEYSDDRLAETARALQSFYRFFERYVRITGSSFFVSRPASAAADEFSALRTRFFELMDDDFNTGGAVGVLFELLSALNRFADAAKLENTAADATAKSSFIQSSGVLRELSSILGLFWAPVAASKGDGNLLISLQSLAADLSVPLGDDIDSVMQILMQARADARKAKNFALGDQIRKRLTEAGVTLEDRPGGKTDWRVG